MNIQEHLKKYLFYWFIAGSILLFLPSIILLVASVWYSPPATLPQPPQVETKIALPDLDKTLNKDQLTLQTDLFKKQADYQTTRYEKQINLYKEQINAWKQAEDNIPNLDPYSIYQLVVKDTLVPLITTLLTAFVTYAFVVKTAESVQSYVKEKQAQRLERQQAHARSENDV